MAVDLLRSGYRSHEGHAERQSVPSSDRYSSIARQLPSSVYSSASSIRQSVSARHTGSSYERSFPRPDYTRQDHHYLRSDHSRAERTTSYTADPAVPTVLPRLQLRKVVTCDNEPSLSPRLSSRMLELASAARKGGKHRLSRSKQRLVLNQQPAIDFFNPGSIRRTSPIHSSNFLTARSRITSPVKRFAPESLHATPDRTYASRNAVVSAPSVVATRTRDNPKLSYEHPPSKRFAVPWRE